MSFFGEAIIERLNANCSLNDADNPMRKIIDNGLGDWLDNYDNMNFKEQIFLASATGDYLDLQGVTFKVFRKPDESDEAYRSRIVYESLSHLTFNYIKDVYDLNIFVDVQGMDSDTIDVYNDMMLTSDNPTINNADGYFILLDNINDTRKSSITKKMVLGDGIKWAIIWRAYNE